MNRWAVCKYCGERHYKQSDCKYWDEIRIGKMVDEAMTNKEIEVRQMEVICELCGDVKVYGQKNKRRCPYRYTHKWLPLAPKKQSRR